MVKSEHTNYEPESLTNRRHSPAFHLATYRNPETITKEEMMEEFLSFVDAEFELSQDEMSDLQVLVNEFVGYDIKKVEQGEKELLARWMENVK